MADDHLYFLIDKFMNDLQEAIEEWEEFPLHSNLKGIQDLLSKRIMFDAHLVKILKPCLFKLNELLAECVMIAERRRQIKGALRPYRSAKEFWNLIRARHKLIRIKNILKETIKDIEVDEIVLSSSILVLRSEAFSFRYFHESRIYGLENQEQKIEHELLNNGGHKAIGIIGMGGSGKTALARSVFHRPKVQSHFELRLWIDLSEATDAEKKYFCILVEKFGSGYIKYPFQYVLDEVLSILYGYIRHRKCLVVLDGAWHGNKGIQDFIVVISRVLQGAVIVTSRFWDVAKFLVQEHGFLHSIQPLNPKDCWSIFRDSMEKKINSSSTFRGEIFQMEEEITYRCDGLPLAAKTLAEIMFTQEWRNNPSAWQHATNQSKRMLFEINVHDRVSLGKAWYKVMGLPGVNVERTLYHRNRFLVTGTCTPDDIALELGRFCHVELISIQTF